MKLYPILSTQSKCSHGWVEAGQVVRQNAAKLTALSATGHLTSSVAPGRLSYTFAFQGPSLPVDTVCSSSLVSLHLAASAVGRLECSIALNAGEGISEPEEGRSALQYCFALACKANLMAVPLSFQMHIDLETAMITWKRSPSSFQTFKLFDASWEVCCDRAPSAANAISISYWWVLRSIRTNFSAVALALPVV